MMTTRKTQTGRAKTAPGRFVRVGIVALLLLVAPIGVGTSSAQVPGENLGGYQGSTSGTAVSFRPVFPGVLPTGDAPFEVTVPLTSASVSSGGNSFGQSSLVWPGSAIANIAPLFLQLGEPFVTIAGLLPPYPFVVEASQVDGEKEKNVGPGLQMRAEGAPDGAEAEAAAAQVDFPGFFRVDSVRSFSEATVTGVDVTTRTEVVLEGVSLLDGAITADAIRSVSVTSSTGDEAEEGGDVEVVGLKVGDVEVELTADGLQVIGGPPEAPSEPFPGSNPEETVNQVLEQFQASITLTNSDGGASDGAADHSSTGVLVSVENPAGGEGVGPVAIPPGRFDVLLGSTAANAVATPPFEFDIDSELGSSTSGSGSNDGATVSAGSAAASGSSGALGVPGTGSDSPARLSSPSGADGGGVVGNFEAGSTGVNYSFDGVPVGAIIAAIFAGGFGVRYLRRFFDAIIAMSSTGG